MKHQDIPKKLIFLSVFLALLFTYSNTLPQIVQLRPVSDSERRNIYEIDDFINYSEMRFIRSVSKGNRYTYFGTSNGIVRINNFTKEFEFPFTYCSGLYSDNIYSTIYDPSTNILWALSDKAVSTFSEGNRWWDNARLSRDIYSDNAGNGIFGLGKNYIWIKSNSKFLKSSKFSPNFMVSSSNEVNSDDVKWKNLVSRPNKTFPFFRPTFDFTYFQEGRIQDTYLRSFQFTDFVEDPMNNLLWIGTEGAGIAVGDLMMQNLSIRSVGPAGSSVTGLYRDGSTFWMGGYNNTPYSGITKWNVSEDKWEYFETLKNIEIRSSNVNYINGNDKYIFFATDDGLIVYEKSNKRWRNITTYNNLPINQVTHIEIFNNEIWISTDIGLALMTLPGFIIKEIDVEPIEDFHIYSTSADSMFVWCATELGIYRLDRKMNKWFYIEGASGILQRGNKAISKNGDEIWFVSDNGIQMYNSKLDEWTSYPDKMYFQNIDFNYIFASEDIIWFATNQGLIKYHRKDDFWKIYTTGDGLPSNNINHILPDEDYLWLATNGGLVRFYWNNPKHRNLY
ncbi:two-component regulator propeller domain-containing protein [candidate division KSB1 bacterium]